MMNIALKFIKLKDREGFNKSEKFVRALTSTLLAQLPDLPVNIEKVEELKDATSHYKRFDEKVKEYVKLSLTSNGFRIVETPEGVYVNLTSNEVRTYCRGNQVELLDEPCDITDHVYVSIPGGKMKTHKDNLYEI